MPSDKARQKFFPGIARIRELPVQLTMTIPPEWEDRNGHVNVQFYLALYELGGWEILEEVGIDEAWFAAQRYSVFDIEHHLDYRSEIIVGEQVTAYGRILGRSDRRFHGMYFMVNDTRESLAASLEYLTAGVDMQTRRSAPFPDELAAALDRQLEKHRLIGWAPPTCGLMSP